MGDCIKQARAFVQCCQTALDRANDASPDDMTDVLAEIQSGAKLNRARAIYRAAQDALHCLDDENRLPTRLFALSNIVSLYETGLVEMENESETSDPQIRESADIIADIITVDFSNIARQSRAIDALKNALPFADDAQKSALETLLELSNEAATDNADISVETLNGDIDSALKTEQNPTSTPAAKVPLESFIRDIIQSGLSTARQSKLTLSVSYDMDGVSLPADKADIIQTRTEAWLTCLIRHLATSSDENVLNHIDLSATKRTLTLRTVAPPLGDGWRKACDHEELVSIEHDALTRTLSLNLALIDTPEPAMPKMPVEEGISSRLAALLDTTLTDEFSPDNFRIGAVS